MVRLDEELKKIRDKRNEGKLKPRNPEVIQVMQESPKEIIDEKEILKKESGEQETENFKENEINWLEDDFYDDWDKVKGHWHNIAKPNSKEIFKMNESPKIEKWFFLAHFKDEIEGKPQLVHDVMQRIPLIRLTSKINKEGSGKDKTEWKTPQYLFFDERYDKRYDGAMISIFALDFWIYKIKYNGKEHYVYSQDKLPDGKCRIQGMSIDLADVSEMSNTLKINSLSHIFIVKEAESAVKTLSKKDLVKFVKDKKIDLEKWLCHISQHPLGTINKFPIEVEILRSSILLSGKESGWPLHLAILGPHGSRKTMGHGETIYSKFDEEIIMASATNYNLKGLIPSFRKSPAEPGYLLRCHRIAIIDEIGKLVEKEAKKHDRTVTNVMGEFNDILEHKQRSGGSGNDFIDINPTAKGIFILNPVKGKESIYQHVGLIDPTTMSRILWWVQDEEEQEIVMGDEGIIRNPPHSLPRPLNPPHSLLSIYSKLVDSSIIKKSIVLKKCRGCVTDKETFLTTYDSCNNFLSDIDDLEVNKLTSGSLALSKEPMRGIWKPRSYHITKLLIDGIVKMRCLFDDHDSSFTAKQQDYDIAERILVRMVKGWDTDLSIKGAD
jgi:hypothetical protein